MNILPVVMNIFPYNFSNFTGNCKFLIPSKSWPISVSCCAPPLNENQTKPNPMWASRRASALLYLRQWEGHWWLHVIITACRRCVCNLGSIKKCSIALINASLYCCSLLKNWCYNIFLHRRKLEGHRLFCSLPGRAYACVCTRQSDLANIARLNYVHCNFFCFCACVFENVKVVAACRKTNCVKKGSNWWTGPVHRITLFLNSNT